jgi:DNA replication protein DnaC
MKEAEIKSLQIKKAKSWLKKSGFSKKYIKNIFRTPEINVPLVINEIENETLFLPADITEQDRQCRYCDEIIDCSVLTETLLSIYWTPGICSVCKEKKYKIAAEEKRAARIKEANIPDQYLSAQISDIPDARLDFFDGIDLTRHLWITGKNRTGKTHCSISYLKELALDYPIKFQSFFKLFKADMNNTAKNIEEIIKFKGVVLFDNVRSISSEYWLSKLEDIVCARYEDLLPTIFTTNIQHKDFQKVFGETMTSRIEESSAVIEFDKLIKKD